ncbi:preprotein translocase subunit SecA [Anseongella ginsenosidimutans]|uniref:Protein translocase subunit SecA n=1 Tax=Anseongella ginsenosidimutans TaxID=496056 RepID=A0A4V2UUA7_9SPHI|nr:preprotein translocase subunit SecA [Anseongella ginsenosidimutans]QEC51342.1 preprotein translocase subunit SecA [Anseongella ginsenosidimutans]TCS89963.1 preprotein translocase subunit SecA [Anseongella ginsenosidimutans]
MLNIFTKLFGTKSDKDVKGLLPLVQKINEEYDKLQSLSNDGLRDKTTEFKQRIAEYLQKIDGEIAELKKQGEAEGIQVHEKVTLYDRVDKLEKERNKSLEEILWEILPEAFAVMKETARRFKENEILEVTATEMDRDLAATRGHVEIAGDKARYQNRWLASGNEIVWDMLHYDVQLIGGIVLHQGKISEMATGEGKTLVATCPAYLNALGGLGVHIVTVNDYLARRDSEWMGPLFEFHGLRVDCIDKHQPNSPNRRKAYQADIIYGTNNEYGFDYLRDNMARSPEDLVQGKLHYAMVDEVDSVLIDDARTPLIISGPVPKGDQHEFYDLKPRIERLVTAQKNYLNAALNAAKKQIAEGNTEEGGLALLRAHRGLPKNKALIKFLSEPGIKQILQKTENHYLQDQQREMHKADAELFFVIDEKNNSVELTEKGIELITASGEDASFFIMPDMGSEVAEIERSDLPEEEKVKKKDELMRDYGVKSERIHSVNQLLKAYTLFEKDVEYIIDNSKIKIVDEQTGRVMEGRRYSDGLHQAIEAKENVKVEDATQTFATVTLQNYFRMYHKLAGMTGTASTEAGELWEIYKLDVVEIPTNKPLVRDDRQDLVYKTQRAKYNAVIEEIAKLTGEGRPVLVGTTSVEISELLSRMLKLRGIRHNVLNAKLHQKEADIVAEAGIGGTVTIATNMAGRGTDIKLGPGVKDAGGLAIIGTERHESRRVDRQLRGRAGRQGDPGASQFFVSLQDDLMRLFTSDRVYNLMDKMGLKEDEVIQHSMITRSIERAQRKVEENNFGIRKRLLEYDDVMNSQRTVIYSKRHNALFGERLEVDLDNMLFDLIEEIVAEYSQGQNYEGFKLEMLRVFSYNIELSEQEFQEKKPADLLQLMHQALTDLYRRKSEQIAEMAYPVIKEVYETRGETFRNIAVPFTDGVRGLQVQVNLEKAHETRGKEIIKAFEKMVTLSIIDESWKEHLRDMDDLRQSVQNAVYEQKDPLLIYKFESFELFKQMISRVNREVISFLFKGSIPLQQPEQVREARQQPRPDTSRLRTNHPEYVSAGAASRVASAGGGMPVETEVKTQPVRVGEKVGRNDPCPCGSGKKYKNCHGK